MSFCSSPPTTHTKLGGLHNRCSFPVKSTFNNTNMFKPSWVDFTTKEQMSFCSSPPTTHTKLGGLHNRCSFPVKSTFNNTNMYQTKLGGLHNKRTDVILFITSNNTHQVGWTSQQMFFSCEVHFQQHKHVSNQVGWTSQQKNRHFVHHLQQHTPSWVDLDTHMYQTKLGGLHNKRTDVLLIITLQHTQQKAVVMLPYFGTIFNTSLQFATCT